MNGDQIISNIEDIKGKISAGGHYFIAAAEELLAQLPKGDWIGGTIPYFMTEAGGVHARDKVYAMRLPEYIKEAEIRVYSEATVQEVYKDAPLNGFSLIILPSGSSTLLSFALNAPHYENFAAAPLAGWVAGVPLAEMGRTKPKVVDGRTGQLMEDAAVVMHVPLPKGRTARVGTINIFEPSEGDVLQFTADGFSATEVLVNGEKRELVGYLAEKKLDTRRPLVASYGSAIVNVSFQEVNAAKGEVKFYAPVFKGVEYRHARPTGDYVSAFSEQAPVGAGDRLIFSCNCILNYVHSGLEGKITAGFTGPITFGEVAYQLLNQTAVYIEIVSANLAERLRDEAALSRLNREIRRQRDEILVLKSGIEQSSQALVLTDTAGKIEYINPAGVALYGYTAEELLGGNPRIFRSGETPSVMYESMWKTLSAGRIWTGELRNKTKSGELVWVQVNVTPVRNAEGAITHFMAMYKNITVEKRLMTEVVEAKWDAERANQAKSDFLASMSHEIRTPLNAIVGMSELIDEGGLDREQAQYLSIMRKASDTLLTLINDVLDISKIEAGKVEMEKAPFDLEELVSTVAEIMSVRASEKGVEVSCKIEADVPVCVEGDVTRLRQVLMNLMGNAVKFVEKGWIYLNVSKQREENGTMRLLFSVRDTGIGIAADKLEAVFDKFTQADASTTRKYGGTGLGLPISKMLIELMGGRIWVESKPGEGTVFSFTVDLSGCKDSKAVYLPKADIAELKGRRFLVVDDNLVNRIIIREIVQSWGAHCEAADNGEKGLERVREAQADRAPFHGIFVDFNMPGMDGYGFCRRVREDAAIEPKPALAIVTSDTVRLKRKDFQDIGVVTYMMKPVKKQALLDGALEMLAASGTSVKQAVVKQGGYEKGDLPELSILVADDAEDNRVLMSAMLKGSRIKLELAVDGRDALEKLGKNKYDLVFMDMLMPEMDGYVATEKFRELEAREGRKRTKVVALTAMATRDDAEKTIKAGCDDYLSKPIRRNTFYSYLVNFAAGRA